MKKKKKVRTWFWTLKRPCVFHGAPTVNWNFTTTPLAAGGWTNAARPPHGKGQAFSMGLFHGVNWNQTTTPGYLTLKLWKRERRVKEKEVQSWILTLNSSTPQSKWRFFERLFRVFQSPPKVIFNKPTLRCSLDNKIRKHTNLENKGLISTDRGTWPLSCVQYPVLF